MSITVERLIALLNDYDPDTVIKLAVGTQNGLTIAKDFGFVVRSTEEVYGKEIVIHPTEFSDYFEVQS